jgi:hypothetical protein
MGIWPVIKGNESDKVKIKEATAQIMLTLKDKPLNGVIGEDSAKEVVWEKLSNSYEGKCTQKLFAPLVNCFKTVW